MIFDYELTLYRLVGGTPLQGELAELQRCLYSPMEVFSRRYWQAIQAGVQIDTMAALPFHFHGEGELFARLADERIYRVEQLQLGEDSNGLPLTTLSLSRTDRRFEILNDDKE